MASAENKPIGGIQPIALARTTSKRKRDVDRLERLVSAVRGETSLDARTIIEEKIWRNDAASNREGGASFEVRLPLSPARRS